MRLLRWDRGGVVVTKKIQFDNPSLFDFFWRFTSATPAQRGRDPTVITANVPGQTEEIQHLLGCDEEAPLSAISAGNKEYIISKNQPPSSISPIGHSTRCFKAYCLENQTLVLLKDSWRIVSPTLKPEHEIYARLHENGVQNIPQVIHGTDIGDKNDSNHITQSMLWLDKTGNPLEFTLCTHQHYRIVFEYLPFTLEEFQSAWEMIAIIRDASIGM
ncbi:hypothetical protein C0992_012774 [Termitomyces sp. T32_za158]|nr:hypothetical protein C0992_012774 [Termitomyces sp. T32_za158]